MYQSSVNLYDSGMPAQWYIAGRDSNIKVSQSGGLY
jgi:hypothetical protein